jgi:hypothetical protein
MCDPHFYEELEAYMARLREAGQALISNPLQEPFVDQCAVMAVRLRALSNSYEAFSDEPTPEWDAANKLAFTNFSRAYKLLIARPQPIDPEALAPARQRSAKARTATISLDALQFLLKSSAQPGTTVPAETSIASVVEPAPDEVEAAPAAESPPDFAESPGPPPDVAAPGAVHAPQPLPQGPHFLQKERLRPRSDKDLERRRRSLKQAINRDLLLDEFRADHLVSNLENYASIRASPG